LIQRIQSVWFFLASVINGLLLLPSIYLYRDVRPGGVGIPGMASVRGSEFLLGTSTNLVLMLLAVLITLLPLIAIFLFKNRKQQRGLGSLAIVGCIAFVAAMVMIIQGFNRTHPGDAYLIPWPVLPVVGLVLIILAIRGVRKDEKVLKSLDRLR
jgi:peptidoglycan/LPS O-acetylase OafA/YrhL